MKYIAGNREGIGCRLKCLVSVMRKYEDYGLYWELNKNLRVEWHHLFENDILVKKHIRDEIKSRQRKDPTNTQLYFSWRWDSTPEERERWGRKYFDWEYDKIPKPIYDGNIAAIAKLKPIKYIREEIKRFRSQFDDKTASVCVRTWKDVRQTKRERAFKWKWVFKHTDNIPEDHKIFLTSDNEKTLVQFQERYGIKRVLYYPKRTYWGDWNSIKGMQDTVIELYLPGYNPKMYLSWHSGFTEAQWWFGGAKAEVIEMARYK